MSYTQKVLSTYWSNPYELSNFLTATGFIEKIHAAMEMDDVTHLAMTAYKVLPEVGLMPVVTKQNKSAKESKQFRIVGNKAFQMAELDSAMAMYNKALKYAPKNSEEFILALNHRSTVLYKLKCYEACIKDIDKCLSIKCPDSITIKLKNRRHKCSQNSQDDALKNQTYYSVDDYFKFNVKRHPEINCASTDIDVIIEDGLPKIVAAKDISVGTVIAIETPYMTHLSKLNYDMACYYCHKFALNLMPCDGCVTVLFCSDECRKICMDEYHEFECKIMGLLDMFFSNEEAHLAVKAALKIKSKCSWKKFVTETNKMGVERMRDTPISEIFDGDNGFSMLSYNNSYANLVHGTQYNFSFCCAAVLNALEDFYFFPHASDEKLNAMHAFAKVVMNFRVIVPRIFMGQTATAIATQVIGLPPSINLYLLSFSSRLKRDCEANTLLLPLLNKVAAVSLRPIKKGNELTISVIQGYYHCLHTTTREKNLQMYRLTQSVCSCRVCRELWNPLPLKSCKMTPEQRQVYLNWRNNEDFKTTCQAMEAFDSVPYTKEHKEIYTQFIVLQNVNQYAATGNTLPRKLRPDIIRETVTIAIE